MSWEPAVRIVFFAVFIFLTGSMFFNRIFPRFGYTFSPQFIGVQIGLCVTAIFLHGMLAWGLGRALFFIGISTSIGFAAEWLGVKTGTVFGRYRYTDKSGPRLFGVVPVFVPLMWCVITYIGFWTAEVIGPNGAAHPFYFIGTASLLTTAWDMVADPVVVYEGAWTWETPGKYCGVPMANFMGWCVTATVIFSGFIGVGGKGVFLPMIPSWMGFLPTAGYVILSGVFSYAAFERKLILPGVIGLVASAGCVVAAGIRLF
jgi:uncharacterized membrane protein